MGKRWRCGGAGGGIPRAVLPVLPMMLVALLMGLGTPVPVVAREGPFLGIGLVSQRTPGAPRGTETYAAATGASEVRVGELDSGRGVFLAAGYGLNGNVVLEFLLARSRHDSLYLGGASPSPPTRANLTSILAGAKFTLPIGDRLEVSGRAGVGGYELNLYDGNVRVPQGKPLDGARLTGRGIGLGAGAEFLFDGLGLELGWIRHRASLQSLETVGVSSGLSPSLALDIDAIHLQLSLHY